MNVWKTSSLGEVVSIVGGGTPTRSNPDFYGGTIPWVTPKDMKSWEITGAQITITQSGLDNSATRVVPKNSILIVVRSGVLKHTIPVALNRLPVAINQDMKALQCRDGIDAEFLARFIKAQSPVILQWVRATTADNFPIDKLKKLPVPLPPLAEQRRIAEVLDRAEALRTKRRAALAQLDSLIQSLFLDLFGDPATNPRGWPKKSLGDVARERPNNGIFRKNPDYIQEGKDGLPVVWVEELFRGDSIDTKDSRRVIPAGSEVEKYGLKTGDILFCRSSLKLDGIAFNNVYLGKDDAALFECHLIRISPDLKILSPVFLNCLLRLPKMRAIAKAKSKTATMTTIDQQNLCSIDLPLPPIELQREFAHRVGAVENLKTAQRVSLAELDALFASLQHRAFRGEL